MKKKLQRKKTQEKRRDYKKTNTQTYLMSLLT